ncbi:MAG: TIGR01212 family radical SAM protein [Clostridia bacterium]|nr:TIGR01212 family radical SAM protein [Clostridia bacterium]
MGKSSFAKYYYSLNQYLDDTFGEKVYKLSLDIGMTCPNRDGTKGIGGCIFCNGGSGEFAESSCRGIETQLRLARQRVSNKTKAKRFIAYFQSYTNTYAPVSKLREVFDPIIRMDDIVALSIGTRPDCLGEDILEYLSELNRIKPVFVELGLQTIHGKTAKLINRCYETEEYFSACAKLKEIGIHVVTHVIFGLPGEDEKMMLETIRQVGRVTDGIKMHVLYVLKGTELYRAHRDNLKLLSLEEYTNLLIKSLDILPKRVVIHRLTGDPPKALLEAPEWTKDKKRVLNYINKELERHYSSSPA